MAAWRLDRVELAYLQMGLSKMSGKKVVNGLKEAVLYDNAISAVYRVLEGYPKYALSQMNDHLASDIVKAVRDALSPQESASD
jgi:hypothetical protein